MGSSPVVSADLDGPHSAMKTALLEIWRAGLQAVHPDRCLPARLRRAGNRLRWSTGELNLDRFSAVWILGIGKAAATIARALHPLVADRLAGGCVLTAPGYAVPVPELEVLTGSHPLPTAEAEEAGQRLWEALARPGPRDLVLWITSGGGSALWALYRDPLCAEEARQAFDLLLRSGMPIRELNLVRRLLLRWANGGVLRRIRARVLELILCDVPGEALEAVASGPLQVTVEDPSWAISLLQNRGLWPLLPKRAREALAGARAPVAPSSAVLGRLPLASGRTALSAMAREAGQRGFQVWRLTDRLEGEAGPLGRLLVRLADGFHPRRRARILLWAGESTVTLSHGAGRGGRNQELALAAALELEGRAGAMLLAASTDGQDGPTDAAGALVDGYTAERVRLAGLDPEGALREHNSYPALDAADALLRTGPTGTNVADLGALLLWPA
jgi:glycerate 2-kinase